jgi:ketosteroid isomerase-like protein
VSLQARRTPGGVQGYRKGECPVSADVKIKTIEQIYEVFGRDLHHYFRFRDGKIACYRGTEDTAQTEAALRD